MSAGIDLATGIAADRPSGTSLPRSSWTVAPDGSPRRIRVSIIGATGYVGSELTRILARHPNVEIVGLVARGREREPIEIGRAHV